MMQDRCRHPEQCRPSQCAAQRTREVGVRHRRRRRRVHRAGQRRRGDDMRDQPHEIVALDPGHPLPAAADRTAETELKRKQKLAQHPAVGAENQTNAQPHHPHAQALRLLRLALPGLADAMRETALAAVEFGQRFVLPQAVPADGGAADHDRGTLLQACDQAIDRARHAQPRRQDPPSLAARPQRVAGRLAGEIDHGVDPSVVRDLREARDDAKRRPQHRGLDRVAREHGDVVTGAGQRLDQPAADEAGRAGDEHMLPERQRFDEHRRVAGRWTAPEQMRDHDANSRYKAICRSISPKRGCTSCRVKLKRPSGTSAWITVSSPGQSQAGRTKRRPNTCTK